MQIGVSAEAANGLHLDGEFLIVRGERGEASLSEPLFKLLELLIACKQRAAYIDWLRDALGLTQWAVYKQVLRLRQLLKPIGWEIHNGKGAYRLRPVVKQRRRLTGIRKSREAFNAYHRDYKRRSRAAQKAEAEAEQDDGKQRACLPADLVAA